MHGCRHPFGTANVQHFDRIGYPVEHQERAARNHQPSNTWRKLVRLRHFWIVFERPLFNPGQHLARQCLPPISRSYWLISTKSVLAWSRNLSRIACLNVCKHVFGIMPDGIRRIRQAGALVQHTLESSRLVCRLQGRGLVRACRSIKLFFVGVPLSNRETSAFQS